MKIIPVIDLKDGAVVHAREGKRDQYLPLKTRLCESAALVELIRALVTAFHVDTVYIADLNAITGQGGHQRLIDEALAHFPELVFWVDQGYLGSARKSAFPKNYWPVLGSESYRDNDIIDLEAFNKRFILSLDYSISGGLGSQRLFSDSELWPDNIIVMTLERVGSHKGPDFGRLAEFCKRYPDKNFIAAGGIRNRQDLLELKAIGISRALVASALHSGAISAEDMTMLEAKKYPG